MHKAAHGKHARDSHYLGLTGAATGVRGASGRPRQARERLPLLGPYEGGVVALRRPALDMLPSVWICGTLTWPRL